MSFYRYTHPRHVPYSPASVGLVDQYSWAVKDSNTYHSVNNGIAYPIYGVDGHIKAPVPLEHYGKFEGDLAKQTRDVRKRIHRSY